MDKQGWGQSEAVADRLEAFEDGHVGWASWLLTIQTPAGPVNLRGTAALVLEGGAWRVIQWHNSAPSPNVQTSGVELTTTIDDLLASVETDDAALGALDRTEGTLTLMFADIVDSTALAEEIGDDGWSISFEPAGTFTLKGLLGTHELVHLENSAFNRT